MTRANRIALLCLLSVLCRNALGSAILDHRWPPGLLENHPFLGGWLAPEPDFDLQPADGALNVCSIARGDVGLSACGLPDAAIGIWVAAAIADSARGRPLVCARQLLEGGGPEHVPEPSTVWLIVAGLIALAAWRLHRRV